MVGQVFVLLVSIVWSSCVSGIMPTAVLSEQHIIWQRNTENTLNCSITSGLLSVDNLFFKFNDVNLRNFTYIFSDRIVQLTWTPSEIMSGNISCVFSNSTGQEMVLDSAVVKIGDPPVKPTVGCGNYNHQLNCTWWPSEEQQEEMTGIPTTQTFTYLKRCRVAYHCRTRLNATACTIDPDRVSVVINARNHLGTVNTILPCMEYPVKRNPAVFASERFEITNTTAKIVWKSPMFSYLDVELPTTTYLVTLVSQWTDDEDHPLTRSSNVTDAYQKVWSNLRPNTMYEVTVRVTEEGSTLWSDATTQTITTLAGVPDSGPESTRGSFAVSNAEDQEKRKVYLYWKNLPEYKRHGQLDEYRVRYKPSNTDAVNYTTVGPDAVGAELVIDREREYEVIVDAKTAAGYNTRQPDHPWTIPKDSDILSESPEVIMSREDGMVYLNWTGVTNATLTTNMTVYWCRKDTVHQDCREGFDWEVVPGGTDRWSRFLPDHLVGVSVERKVGSEVLTSGFQFSDCFHPLHGELKPPVNVRLQEIQYPGSVALSWEKPKCSETIYISHFILYYCKSTHCEDGLMQELVVKMNESKTTVNGLEPGQKYFFWMQSAQHDFFSSPSQRIPYTILTDGLKLASWKIALIVIACIIGAIIIVIGIFECFKCIRKSRRRMLQLPVTLPDRFVYSTDDSNQNSANTLLTDDGVYYHLSNDKFHYENQQNSLRTQNDNKT